MAVMRLTPDQIESWIARHFEYRRRKGGEELIIRNPFIPNDQKFKFNISTRLKETKQGYKGYWVHDWRPSSQQYNMSFIRFVQLYKGLTFKEALKDEISSVTVCGLGIDPGELDKKAVAYITWDISNRYSHLIEVKIIDDNEEFINEINKFVTRE